MTIYGEVEQVTRMLVRAVDETGLDSLDPAVTPARDAKNFRRILAARRAVEAAQEELREAVADARAAGDSWTIIGAALGVKIL